MKKFGNILRLALCLTVVAIAPSVPTAAHAAGPPGGLDVNVVNTPSNPVPVTLQGTGSVSGSVTVNNTTANPVPVSGNVAVTNTTTSPVPTQNVGGGAATQVGQPASHVINLRCLLNPNPGTCFQISPDGKLATTAFSVPTTQAFVITDLQWTLSNSKAGQGNYDGVDALVNLEPVTSLLAPVDGLAVAAGQAHLSGIVAAPGASILVDRTEGSNPVTSVVATLQGYLVPNQ